MLDMRLKIVFQTCNLYFWSFALGEYNTTTCGFLFSETHAQTLHYRHIWQKCAFISQKRLYSSGTIGKLYVWSIKK